MSWRKAEDLGTTLVAKVHDQLKANDSFVLDCGRGFTYWPSSYPVTVYADSSNFHNAYSIFRIHAEADVSKGGEGNEAVELEVARLMYEAALSALTFDPDKNVYKVHCSVYAHCDNAEWLGKVLVSAVGLQVARVPKAAQMLFEQHHLEPASSKHPKEGARKEPDPLVHAIDRFFKPFGQGESKWLGSEEWEPAYSVVRRMARKSKSDERTSITAEFDWLSDAPIELEISASHRHQDLGGGLFFSLCVPWAEDPASVARAAFKLNDMERREWNWCHDLGSWCIDPEGRLAFTCFVPNLAFAPGCLSDLAHDMAVRARWVNETAALELLGVRAV